MLLALLALPARRLPSALAPHHAQTTLLRSSSSIVMLSSSSATDDSSSTTSTSTSTTTTTIASIGLTTPVAVYEEIVLPSPADGPPRQEITVVDLMPHIDAVLSASGLREGSVNVISRHTTCGVTINEWESRLARDLRTWLLRLAPPDDRSEIGAPAGGVAYEHNDIDARPESEDERQRCLDNGWDVTDPAVLQRWRDQEPINAHSHLAAMLLGSSETVPVTRGSLVLGEWQSVMLVDTDGPRERKVGIQVIGFK